jgi:hypothetical protein
MSKKFNPTFASATLLCLLLLCNKTSYAAINEICWIDSWKYVESGIEIKLDEGNLKQLFVFRAASSPFKSGSYEVDKIGTFTLAEGDVARISIPHNACEFKAEIRENSLGVVVKANYFPLGQPARSVTRFLVPR